MDFDEIDQVFDAEVGEGHLAIFVGAIDPDHAVLDIHFHGDVEQPVLVFVEFLGDTAYRFDVVDFVDMPGQAARAELARACGFQFQGANSSSRCAGWPAMRERTSANQACGSTPFILQVMMRLYIAAARSPRDPNRRTTTIFCYAEVCITEIMRTA